MVLDAQEIGSAAVGKLVIFSDLHSAWFDYQFVELSRSGGVAGRREGIEQQVSYISDRNKTGSHVAGSFVSISGDQDVRGYRTAAGYRDRHWCTTQPVGASELAIRQAHHNLKL
ncbi:MAG TPA: hypothetical protein VNA23_08090 [Anaerolineales bacterium]|nr:hypothetical protein [Anaerolineales bacterium]